MAEEMAFTKFDDFKTDLIRNDTLYGILTQTGAPVIRLSSEKGNAYAIRVDWILKSAIRLTADGEKYMHFVVRSTNKDGSAGETIPPSTYTLWAEGVGDEGDMGVMEDFPPKIWP